MTGEVYISGIYQVGEIGDKLGASTKWAGAEWPKASFKLPRKPKEASAAIQHSASGHKLDHSQYPEAVAVWNEKAFARIRDFAWVSGFLTVKEKVADVLQQFDLGGGELVPVPLYKADRVTPWPEPFYYINYGGPKDTFVPEQSPAARFFATDEENSIDFFEVPFGFKDDGVALNDAALISADIWMERHVYGKLFLNGALVDALHAAKIDVDLRLKKCRIVGG